MRQEEINIEKYSSIGGALSLLAREMAPGRAEGFLREIVNLDITNPTSRSRFEKKFPDFIPPTPGTIVDVQKPDASAIYQVASFSRFIFNLQWLLRSAWERPTTLEREVQLDLTLQEVYKQFLRATDKNPVANPALRKVWKPIGNTVLALRFAQRSSDRLRRCENSSCPAPYFIAERRNQKFCTEICAGPAQREQKRAWWKEHGPEWRKKQGKKFKAPKRKRE